MKRDLHGEKERRKGKGAHGDQPVQFVILQEKTNCRNDLAGQERKDEFSQS